MPKRYIKKLSKNIVKIMEHIKTDILVIGGGGAGCRAAYAARKNNPKLEVMLATEGLLGFSGSTNLFASETLGINAPFDFEGDGDSPDIYYQDMVRTGIGLAGSELCKIIADESAERIKELMDLGLKFNEGPDRKIKQIKLSGCSRARSMSVNGRTGIEIVKVLKEAIHRSGVKIIENCQFLDFINPEGIVSGGIFFKSGGPLFIESKAVILATGGAGRIFKYNVNSKFSFGDYGYAAALKAGAKLVNFEFIQIGPGVVFPPTKFIIHSYMWSFLPKLLNKDGKDFLREYLPDDIDEKEVLKAKRFSYPFSCRTSAKYLDIAIFSEIIKGKGTANGGILLDISHIKTDELKRKAEVLYKVFKKIDFDITNKRLEIAPMVQSFNGGILIDGSTGTGVESLFAVGEASGGVHGADRPGGNNLTESQVFGHRAGMAAADYVSGKCGINKFSREKIRYLLSDSGRTEIKTVNCLKDLFSRYISIIRNKEGLEKVISVTEEIIGKNIKKKNHMLSGSYSMAIAGNAIAKAALLREESRGTHYREDFPLESNFLQRRILVQFKQNKIISSFEK